ncbi:hypothetical protein GLP14_07585 [Photobacterium carnosum]|uniref:hypothetical protein n=1 Tax=Photobacterium carnosum TaxID=2023717 RepID=UPI001E39CBA5|nr:hypothetical protein [Photobacterium carnosum]MCD9522702.1 hypothetical protein [Photobacterium carnosum]
MHQYNFWVQLKSNGEDLVHKYIDRIINFFRLVRNNIESPKKLFRTFIRIVTSTILFIAIAIYLIMMFIKPWLDGDGEWTYVQGVWAHWQTLNASIIAFVASLVAVYVVTYNEKQNRKSHLLAARAMLPQALSDLTINTKALAQFYKETYDYWQLQSPKPINKPKPPKQNIDSAIAILSNCMQHANIEVVEAMAKVLNMNQYISARAQNEYTDKYLNRGTVWIVNQDTQLYELGEMQARINRMFTYGRKLNTELKLSDLTMMEISQGMYALDITDGKYPNAYKYLSRKFGCTMEDEA